ncbi:MAG: NAD(P)-dependent alcohol dehydrogenase [Woeseiaceae bacterium]|nr:NAD(P)-dependent alcohol dehydrogenase [Woeseiaceae bacterium]
MKLWKKILLGFAAVLVLAVGALAATMSYTAPCPDAPSIAAGAETMKAVRARCYGSADVLTYEDVEKPTPGPDEILVRVKAAGVNPLDYHFMRGSPYILRLMGGIGEPDDPRAGADFAGVVETVGNEVTSFVPGDEVFGRTNGTFAEYVTIGENRAVVKKPGNVSFEQAAGVPIAGITALQALAEKGGLEAGQDVLINGASGGVGTFAVQIAKAMGANVSGVCSTRNVAMVESIGADRVFDYKNENYTEADSRFDLIVDMVGNHSPSTNVDLLKADGVLVLVGGPKGNWIAPFKRPLQAMVAGWFADQEITTLFASLSKENMQTLADMMGDGRLVTVIDRTYTLEDVPEAIRHSESGRARGKIIITMD